MNWRLNGGRKKRNYGDESSRSLKEDANSPPSADIRMTLGREEIQRLVSNAVPTAKKIHPDLTYPEVQLLINLLALQQLYKEVGIEVDFKLEKELFE